MKARKDSVIVITRERNFGDIGVIVSLTGSPFIQEPVVADTETYGGVCLSENDFEVIANKL